MKADPALPASLPGLRAVALAIEDAPRLQRFFDANPAYFELVEGGPARADAAREEILDPPPADMSWTRRWLVGHADADGALAAYAGVVDDLCAPGVCHLGLFIVATERHGSGDAQALYRGLEDWARARGAAWMRLGVVAGNGRAERFWSRLGFVEARSRDGVAMGARANTVRVMFKPLAGGTRDEYLALVARDRADAA